MSDRARSWAWTLDAMRFRDYLAIPYVWIAVLSGLLAAIVFAFTYPLLAVLFVIAPVPGISDVVWGLSQLPVKLFGMSLPDTDKAGYTLLIAGRFYGAIVFLAVFGAVLRLGRRAHSNRSSGQGSSASQHGPAQSPVETHQVAAESNRARSSMASSRAVRAITLCWIAALALAIFAAVYMSHSRKFWSSANLGEIAIYGTLMSLLAYSVAKLRSNIVLGINWILLAMISWDLLFNFPGGFLWFPVMLICLVWAPLVAGITAATTLGVDTDR